MTGHGQEVKRKSFIDHIKKLDPTIIVTIDSRVGPNVENRIKNDTTEYHCYFSSFSTQARGITTYIDKKSTIKVNKLFADGEGNVLNLKITDNDRQFVLCCIYGPKKDDPAFF